MAATIQAISRQPRAMRVNVFGSGRRSMSQAERRLADAAAGR